MRPSLPQHETRSGKHRVGFVRGFSPLRHPVDVLGPRPRLGVGCAEDQYRSSRSQLSSASRYIQRPARRTNAEFSSNTCSPRWSLNRARKCTVPVESSSPPSVVSRIVRPSHSVRVSVPGSAGRVLGCQVRKRWLSSLRTKAVYRDRMSASAVVGQTSPSRAERQQWSKSVPGGIPEQGQIIHR